MTPAARLARMLYADKWGKLVVKLPRSERPAASSLARKVLPKSKPALHQPLHP